MKRRRALVGLFSVLLIGLTTQATAEAASAPVILTGTVVNASGAAISGVQVSLYLNGDAAQVTLPSASATSNSAGAFSVPLADSAALDTAAAANGGYVNFDAAVSAGGLFQVRGISRRWTGTSWTDRWGAPQSEQFVMATGTAGVARVKASAITPNAGCGGMVKTLRSTSVTNTIVGELHTAADSTAVFTYGKTADSDISIGVSVNGQDWSLSGSKHIANATTGNAQTWSRGANFGHKIVTPFQYGKYEWTGCIGAHISWEVDPIQWAFGGSDGQDISSADYQCGTTHLQWKATYSPNMSFTRDQNQAGGWTLAASVYGVSLSATSGFSTFVKSYWHFGAQQQVHWLCGNDNFIGYSGRIFAGK